VGKLVVQKMYNPNPVLIGVLESDNFKLEEVFAYQTMQNHSYRCMSKESLKSKDGMVHLTLVHLQMQAFHDLKDSKLGTGKFSVQNSIQHCSVILSIIKLIGMRVIIKFTNELYGFRY